MYRNDELQPGSGWGSWMSDWRCLSEKTAAQLSEHAVGYTILAKTAALAATREAFDRLAKRCAAMAAERAAKEKRTVRH